jgi:hypothetical protein
MIYAGTLMFATLAFFYVRRRRGRKSDAPAQA